MNLFNNILSGIKNNIKLGGYNKLLDSVEEDTRPYKELVELIKRASTLGDVIGLLGWDQDVVCPKGGMEQRAEELGLMAEISHQAATDPTIGKLIKKAKKCKLLTEDEKINLRLIGEDYKEAIKVPDSLARKIAEITSKSETVWKKAKEENNFEMFLPCLEEIVDLYKNSYAPLIDKSKAPYEVMLADYEEDFTIEDMRNCFNEIKKEVIPLVEKIRNKPQPEEFSPDLFIPIQGFRPQGIAEIRDNKRNINKQIAEKLGYDFGRGRLDEAVHPSTSYGTRLTTNYKHGLWDAISSTIHESYHGIYEQNLPDMYRGLPLGESVSMAVHESQSRFGENHVGKSFEFMQFLYTNYSSLAGKTYDNACVSAYKSINRVKPSFIRIQADELTYNLHIILRFEIEQEIFNGMPLNSLPRKWDDKMEEYLGIRPTKYSESSGQDCHFSCGLFGYFPTYILGSMIAAQLTESLKKDIPDFNKLIIQGNFIEIRQWMTSKIHKHGRHFNTKELIKNATGREPDCEDYIKYLKDKYNKLYNII